jgi:hypothetical protein
LKNQAAMISIPIARSRFIFANPKNSQFARLIQTHLAKQVLQEIISSPF